MGGEFRKKGVQVALGPVVGPLGRTVTGGRNWEGWYSFPIYAHWLTVEGISNDPYLDGVLGAATVEGVQGQGVITSVKVSDIDLPKPLGTENDADSLQHFIANEQELYRNPTVNSNNESVASLSSNIDDKTMHELYLWPFQDALKAGSGNVM
jgi:beta-glucosidase